MATNRANLETALRIALANPVQGLAFIDGLLGDPLAPIAVMSDVERAYLGRTLRQHQETPLTPKETCAAVRTMADLARRREAGEIPLDRCERRQEEGWWGFLNLLRSFAATNKLARPAIEHGLRDAYDEQTIRDLLDRYAGGPLSAWAPADRETMLALWARVNTEPPQLAPVRGAAELERTNG